jgi:hypothetical protein
MLDEILDELHDGVDYLNAAAWKLSQTLSNGASERLVSRIKQRKREKSSSTPHFVDHLADVMSTEGSSEVHDP